MPREMAQITEQTGPNPISNPFASSASSPVPDNLTENTKRWSSTTENYRPVEFTIESDKRHSIPIIKPAPPPRAARQSYQSSRQSSRPVSQLPRITDPEKATTVTRRAHEDHEHYEKDYFYENSAEIKSKCLKILLYLSAPVFLTSAVLSIWTLVSVFVSLLLQPVNMFRKTKTLREQNIDLIAPALKIHLSLILASVHEETYSSYSLPMLIIVNLLAPLISVAIALSAWTAAFFWFYAAIIGDPEGLDHESRRSSHHREDEGDGKTSVIAVREWWRRWLTKALR